MLKTANSKSCRAYAFSIDKKLSELKRKQYDHSLIAHSLWECITVLNYAIGQGIQDLEYDIYFELISRKVMEYGLGNCVVADISLKEHLINLAEMIDSKKRNFSYLNPSKNNDKFTLVYNY